MEFELEKNDNQATLTLIESRLDSETAGTLQKELLRLVQEGTVNIVINMRQVEFADSTGLGALLVGRRAALDAGGSFAIAQPQPSVIQLIRVAQLTETLQVI